MHSFNHNLQTNQQRKMSPSSASSSTGTIWTHSATSTDIYFHEPFEAYKLKVQILCKSIGFGEANVEWMKGGSFNRVSKLTFASGDQCVLRVPRDIYPGRAAHAQNVKDQVGIISFAAPHVPVPEILAYDITVDNAIESPYIIQKLAPGQTLAEVFDGDLTTEDHLQIASIIADVLVRMEAVSFPKPGRLVTGPGIPDRCDDFSQLPTSVVIAPFTTCDGEVPQSQSTSPTSVADFMKAIIDMLYESQIHEKYMVPRWTKLREINEEMKKKGLLTCQQSVLWHWDFNPRNILVNRTADNNWKVTAVLDWDGVLSVPRVLTREPPVWLWQLVDQNDQGSDGNHVKTPRKLTSQEEIIKRHFEDSLKAGIDIEDYRADAYDKGRWARRLFEYLHEPFNDSVDWRTYEGFVKDWEAYSLEHSVTEKSDVSDKSGKDATTAALGKVDAKADQSTKDTRSKFCSSLGRLYSAFKKLFRRRRSDA